MGQRSEAWSGAAEIGAVTLSVMDGEEGNGLQKERALQGNTEQIEAERRNPTQARGLNPPARRFSSRSRCNWTGSLEVSGWKRSGRLAG
ncbi:hypothetical protein SRHO_G00276570 [Serrasalmus rhombeus]